MESMAINDPYYETEAAFLILEKFEINATDKNPKNQITLMQVESCLKTELSVFNGDPMQ